MKNTNLFSKMLFILTFCLVLFIIYLFSQKNTDGVLVLEGDGIRIIDKKTGEVSESIYKKRNLSPGEYVFQFEKEGYKSEEWKLEIQKEEIIYKKVQLKLISNVEVTSSNPGWDFVVYESIKEGLGKKIGQYKTPASFYLEPGNYQFLSPQNNPIYIPSRIVVDNDWQLKRISLSRIVTKSDSVQQNKQETSGSNVCEPNPVPVVTVVSDNVKIAPTEKEMLILNGLKWGPIEESMQWDTASQFCRKRGLRLPSKEELVKAFKSNNKNILACLNDCHFWSLDEYAEFKDYAFYVSLSKGNVEKDLKSFLKSFRCVR